MRIVGGKLAGRDLTSPRDFRVRPTAEHVRAALLDVLEPELQGARVLDLYAGTGALVLRSGPHAEVARRGEVAARELAADDPHAWGGMERWVERRITSEASDPADD